MKTLILIAVGFCLASIGFSQKRIVVLANYNIAIPIYADATDSPIKYIIMQDSISEFGYSVEILENSPLRFRVHLQGGIDPQCGPEITGWIDKTQCGVFKRWHYNADKRPFMKLYAEPDKSSLCTEIYEINNEAKTQLLTVLDYAPERWLKVVFRFNSRLYVGWIDRYCSDAYDSCT